MPSLPQFLLKRLYVSRSLANDTDSCQFILRNAIGHATLLRVYGLDVDGTSHPAEAVSVILPDGVARKADTITEEAPLPIGTGVSLVFRLAGVVLAPGGHLLKLRILTRELGALDISISDKVSASPAAAARETSPSRVVEPAPKRPVRPIRVAMIGAGSTVFARQLMADILVTPGLETGTFVLVDIDAKRLELAHRIGEMMASASGRRWGVEATTRRVKALPGCDYVINSIEVAGLRNVRHDYDIPLRYGVDQCIGDTIGPGGIFKMLRTGPEWLAILRDIERLCPGAVVMNYTNPMSAITLLALRATRLPVVGLCHSVQETSQQLATYLDLPFDELRWRCAGINHLAWFTEITHQGKDAYPRLAERAADPEIYEYDPVRFEVMKHFGAFVTESSGHLSEYLPYFRKRPDLLAKYTRPGYRGESGLYANNWPSWRKAGDSSIRDVIEGRSPISLQRSDEYASAVIEGIERGEPRVIHGNVLNTGGLISNLPSHACVEVPVLVDATGLHAVRFGALPEQMAALDRAHISVHELMTAAVLERDARAARHALLLDPLTAAVCSPDEITALFDEMWAAERADLDWFES
jgi:alpha-galactosidase